MNRRAFLFSAGATLGGTVLASRFGRWFRQGSGLLVPAAPENRYIELVHYFDVPQGVAWRREVYIPVPAAPRIMVSRLPLEPGEVVPPDAKAFREFTRQRLERVMDATTADLVRLYA